MRGEEEMRYMLGMFTKKRLHVAVSSIFVMLCCCVSGQAQQGAPTGDGVSVAAVTGSGKTDFIPLWVSATQLGNSKMFQTAAGKIGIGTTAPVATLDVNGAVNTVSSFRLGGAAFAFG